VSQDSLLKSRLEEGLAAMELPVADQARLLDYLRLLAKWNRVYNLTAVRDPAEMVTRHLLDSLAVLPYLHGARVLDVGTGAGLPGIPLAIVSAGGSAGGDPARRFTLLDSNGKKTRFVQQAVVELGLDNVQVVHTRTEDFAPPPGERFDTVLSRAFASIADMLAGSGRHCAPQGVILAMKGAEPRQELAELEARPGYGFRVERVIPLAVPGLDEARHLVCLSRSERQAR